MKILRVKNSIFLDFGSSKIRNVLKIRKVLEFVSDFGIFHPSIFEFLNSRAFIMERPLIVESNSERTSRGGPPYTTSYFVIIPYHPNFWPGRFNSYTPAVMVPIYKVTRVIKMLNFHQNFDFREKNLSSQNFRISPGFTTFTHHLAKQQKSTRD